MSPHDKIAEWMPHVLLLILIILALWLLAVVLSPLRDPLLLGMAVAAVSYPFIYKPIENSFGKRLPNISTTVKKQICGPLAASMIIVVVSFPFFLILFTAGPSFIETWAMIIGVLKHDPIAIHSLADAISGQLENIHNIYPRLHLRVDPTINSDGLLLTPGIDHIQEFNNYIVTFLTTEQDINAVFIHFLKNGSNTLAELIMAFVALSFFYSHGPRLLRVLFDYTPVSTSEQQEMARHHFQVVSRLLTDTIGTAIVKGIVLGCIISLFTPHNFFLISILAAFLSLLPVIGLTMVWLPLSALAWGNGDYITALGIALCSLIANYGLDWLRNHYGRQIHDRDAWTSFLLFLGLVGGIISFGIKGFIVGPVVVVMIAVLGRFWLPLYGFPTDTARFEREH
ncbi:MAG: AI-2E family transporter [Planctomycetes bacterium]|nr:AI-2E family transporter [Planctomycetota bacterium]